jgi:hypothetical protein
MVIFTALQGGLLVMQAKDSIEPLEAALDGALTALASYSSTTARPVTVRENSR